MRYFGWAAAAVVLGGAAGGAQAGTFKAPTEDFPTIQSAIDAASEGDTVLVLPGNHEEWPSFDNRSGITIKSGKTASIRGLTIEGGCSKIKVKGLTILNGGDGIQVHDSEDVLISSVRILDPEDDGIDAEDVDRLRIEKCFISGAGGDGIESDTGQGTLIQKNVIEDVGEDGIDIFEIDGDFYDGVAIVVTRNRITTVGNGIVAAGNGILVSKNTIGEVENEGIVVPGDPVSGNIRIEKNTIVDDNATNGIRVEGSLLTVSGNKLTGCGIDEAGGPGNRVERNTVRDADTGIDVSGGFTQVYRNNILGGDTGITTRGEFVTVDMNRITAPAGTGISVVEGNVVTFRNRVTNAGAYGFLVHTTGNDFERDSAKGSGTLDYGDANSSGSSTRTLCSFGTTGFDIFD